MDKPRDASTIVARGHNDEFPSGYAISQNVDNDDDDDESNSYVRPLLQLETVTSVLVIRPGKQFSFQTTTERGWQLRIGAGREFQVDGPATAKLRGPYRSVLVAGTARSPRAADRR